MVCTRCVEAVEKIGEDLGLPVEHVEIGRVRFSKPIGEAREAAFANALQERGFDLVVDRETELASRVQTTLIEYVQHLENCNSPKRLSEFISGKLHYNYSYLSTIFNHSKRDTIESQLIKLKIERVKELISFNRYTLSEIAWKLKYSSVQYLSNQFKKVTGMTVTEYKKSNTGKRQSIDQL